ncbi:helix-turn-helix protein [Maribacter spongiicola]|uniref:Helix-turn-helix protein n=1 Tax=Maribacter spongiicola TaxID=1206753 RepID=A0A4V3ERX1_9FLAO|nr:helix-turn-helix transcriptional regulator [Maribacter spongiicola]TDT47043.1 helix-turn-helix protein [Maribacter spongiicola]
MGSQLHNDLLLLQISAVLKKIRHSRGLTQEDVYNDTGIHISRMEAGHVNFTITTLQRLCEYFEVSLVDFFKNVQKHGRT